MEMRRFIDTFELSPDENLDLLELHTRDAALTTVSRFKIAAGFDPEQAVEKLWKELSCRFGSSARIAKALQDKLHGLSAIGTDMTKLSDFHNECEIVFLHMDHVSDLAVLNYTHGLAPLFHKLPQFIQNKWQSVVYRYSTHEHDKHPPFADFCKFLAEQVQTFSNTLSLYQNHADNMKTTKDKRIFKSDVPTSFNQAAPSNQPTCPLHKIRSNHTLTNCREFQKLNVGSRLGIIKENKHCFRCFGKHKPRTVIQPNLVGNVNPNDITISYTPTDGHLMLQPAQATIGMLAQLQIAHQIPRYLHLQQHATNFVAGTSHLVFAARFLWSPFQRSTVRRKAFKDWQ